MFTKLCLNFIYYLIMKNLQNELNLMKKSRPSKPAVVFNPYVSSLTIIGGNYAYPEVWTNVKSLDAVISKVRYKASVT